MGFDLQEAMSDDHAPGFVSRNDQLNFKSNRKSKRGKGRKKDGTVKKGKSKRKNKKNAGKEGKRKPSTKVSKGRKRVILRAASSDALVDSPPRKPRKARRAKSSPPENTAPAVTAAAKPTPTVKKTVHKSKPKAKAKAKAASSST